jgi:hypothetical protein
MIEQIKNYESNILALEVIDGFTETDEKIFQKFFHKKIVKGFDHVNVLIKLDEMKISKSAIKAFFEDMLWSLRNFKNLGRIAIVAHSRILKASVPIDNLFFERASKGREERYFDISQIEEAFKFIESAHSVQ